MWYRGVAVIVYGSVYWGVNIWLNEPVFWVGGYEECRVK